MSVETIRTLSSTGVAPPEIVDAIEAGVVKIVRRVEVYESDGETKWNPDTLDTLNFSRLVDGSVSVSYDSDERRVLDLTMDNQDELLRPNPVNGFWYDKVIKIFRGVQYQGNAITPRVALIEAPNIFAVNQMRRVLSGFGFTKVDYLPDATSSDELEQYSFVVAYPKEAATTKSTLLKEAWRAGKQVITVGTGSGHTEIPLYTNSSAVGSSAAWNISPSVVDTPASGAFTNEQAGVTLAGRRPTATAAGTVRIALTYGDAGTSGITAAIAASQKDSYWFDLHMPEFGVQTKRLMRATLNFMRGYTSRHIWETQMGEFVIDTINEDNFPSQIKVTGRDYTKRMMTSKLANAVTFEAGTSLRELLIALAANSGVNVETSSIGTVGERLAQDMSYDRGTDRWSIAKAACLAHNYEIFFNAFGKLTVRKFIDPTTGPTSWVFKTGHDGREGANLVKYSRTISDSNIYNHLVVTSDPSDGEERLPYFAEAENNDADSPTSIRRIGRRTLVIETNWLNSSAECLELAKARLKISSLESYAINFDAIYYPWLETGEVWTLLDPERLDFEPTRFLGNSITYPLGLGPMTATAGRITFVGDSGTIPVEDPALVPTMPNEPIQPVTEPEEVTP